MMLKFNGLAVGFGALMMSGAWAQDAPVTESEDAEARQETIIVTGRAAELYRVNETSTGKLPTEPLSSSLNIAVITDELIEDQGARSSQDLYRNLSGVSVFSYAGVTARGFRQEEIFFDGLRGDPYAGFSVPQLFNVERLEFLKGPAGMLYGPGAPGGLFNYITKKPSDEFDALASLIVGSEARYGASLEMTGALTQGGPAGRFGLFYEDQNTPRRNAGSEIFIGDAGLGFDLGFADLTLQVSHYDQDLAANRLRGVPVNELGNFITDRRWNHNEPDDFLRLSSTVYQAQLDGELFDSLVWDAGIRFNDREETQQYHEPRGLFPRQDAAGNFLDADFNIVADPADAETVMVREYRDQLRDGESLSVGANAVWSAEIGGFENRFLFGADYYSDEYLLVYDRARSDNVSRPTGGPNPLGLLDPAYGNSDRSTYVLSAPFGDRTFEQTRLGAYALNEITLGQFILTGGLRFDQFEDSQLTVRGDQSQFVEADDDAVTYRLGAVYRLTDEASFYAQAADSFVPASGADRNGNLLDPVRGDILEGGLKLGLMDGQVQATAAIYQIKQTNLPQVDTDPDAPPGALIAFGEVTSEGFEADIAADITDNWVLTAAYAYNDTRITGDNGTGGIRNAVGDRFANAPEHQFGFWTRYQIPRYQLAFALGGDYVDVRQNLEGTKVRPYTVFDASIIWEPEPYRFLLRVDNVFNEEYAASGFLDRTGHFPGEPVSVFLEASRRF